MTVTDQLPSKTMAENKELIVQQDMLKMNDDFKKLAVDSLIDSSFKHNNSNVESENITKSNIVPETVIEALINNKQKHQIKKGAKVYDSLPGIKHKYGLYYSCSVIFSDMVDSRHNYKIQVEKIRSLELKKLCQ